MTSNNSNNIETTCFTIECVLIAGCDQNTKYFN